MSDPHNRRDVRAADPAAGTNAWEVLCLFCGAVRGTYAETRLPEPGVCHKCRGGDPRTYWTRDWEKSV